MPRKILIAGGAGFIGSTFAKKIIKRGYNAVMVDKLNYAADLKRLDDVKARFEFYKADICNKSKVEEIIKKEKIKYIVNFSAETHVDRSIKNSLPFVRSNILGVQVLLELARKYNISKFIQLSTDEVYGEISKGSFSEESPLLPNSPYAASKACADMLIRTYVKTYSLPAIIIRPCNNYGPWQYPEKFIPLAIFKVLRGERIPVYGNGRNVREWLYVDDCADGIARILEKGTRGEIYNLGSGNRMENLEVARMILEIMNKDQGLICFVKDRPGHDLRYSLNSEKIFKECAWKTRTGFVAGLERTISWCFTHKKWISGKWTRVTRLYKQNIWASARSIPLSCSR